MSHPYVQFSDRDLVLRDHMALDRTVMASERTFLSYVRTSLNFLIVGISLLKLFDTTMMHVTGAFFFGFAFISFAQGYLNYKKSQQTIGLVRQEMTQSNSLVSTIDFLVYPIRLAARHIVQKK